MTGEVSVCSFRQERGGRKLLMRVVPDEVDLHPESRQDFFGGKSVQNEYPCEKYVSRRVPVKAAVSSFEGRTLIPIGDC